MVKLKFWSKNQNFRKTYFFFQKLRFSSKIQIFVKIKVFVKKSEFWSKIKKNSQKKLAFPNTNPR